MVNDACKSIEIAQSKFFKLVGYSLKKIVITKII